MIYKAKTGIILTTIKNEYFLVSARSLHGKVPYISSINDVTAFCWDKLVQGTNRDDIVSSILDIFDVTDEQLVYNDIDILLKSLADSGYIYCVDE